MSGVSLIFCWVSVVYDFWCCLKIECTDGHIGDGVHEKTTSNHQAKTEPTISFTQLLNLFIYSFYNMPTKFIIYFIPQIFAKGLFHKGRNYTKGLLFAAANPNQNQAEKKGSGTWSVL